MKNSIIGNDIINLTYGNTCPYGDGGVHTPFEEKIGGGNYQVSCTECNNTYPIIVRH